MIKRSSRQLYFLIVFILFFFSSFAFTYAVTSTASDDVHVNLDVQSCNNNNICEAGIGENTINCPNDCQASSGGGGGGGGGGGLSGGGGYNNFFTNLHTTPTETTAVITWSSTYPTRSTLVWGTTTDYNDGSLGDISYLRDHKVSLSNLKPGTEYYFSISASDMAQATRSISSTFTTVPVVQVVKPANPTHVRALPTATSIILTWVNPIEANFDYIRIMRSDRRYQSDPYTGTLVYEGRGTSVTDSNVVTGQKYYYTLFARAKNGDFSSGALVSASTRTSPSPSPSTPSTPVTPVPAFTPPYQQALPSQSSGYIYTITELGETYPFPNGSNLTLFPGEPMTISASRNATSDTRDMWVQITEPDQTIDQYFFTTDGTSSLVDIPPLLDKGTYTVTIVAYNGTSDTPLALSTGTIVIANSAPSPQPLLGGYARLFTLNNLITFGILLLLLLLILIIYKIISRFFKK